MTILFASALAEEAANLSQTLGNVTNEGAMSAGTLPGLSGTTVGGFIIIYCILRVIANWKIFTKAGIAGWISVIPVFAEYAEFGMCWKGSYGIFCTCALAMANALTGGAMKHPNGMTIAEPFWGSSAWR